MNGASLILYTVPDAAKAKAFFGQLLGAEPYADYPQYIGYKSGDLEIGIVPNPDPRAAGAVAYWDVSDIAATLKSLEAAGGTIVQPPTDVGYGLLVATVKEPNGSTVGLRQKP